MYPCFRSFVWRDTPALLGSIGHWQERTRGGGTGCGTRIIGCWNTGTNIYIRPQLKWVQLSTLREAEQLTAARGSRTWGARPSPRSDAGRWVDDSGEVPLTALRVSEDVDMHGCVGINESRW